MIALVPLVLLFLLVVVAPAILCVNTVRTAKVRYSIRALFSFVLCSSIVLGLALAGCKELSDVVIATLATSVIILWMTTGILLFCVPARNGEELNSADVCIGSLLGILGGVLEVIVLGVVLICVACALR